MKKLLICLTTFGVISITTTTATILAVDTFPENFDNFTVQTSGGMDGLSWSSDAGVGGVDGRINVGSGSQWHNNAVYYSGAGSAITWETDLVYGASIKFLPGTISGDISHVTTGFIRSTGSNFLGGGSGVWGQLRNDDGGTYLRLFQQNTQVGSNSDTFTLSNTLWYELETSMTLSSATQGELSVSLYSRGTDGTAERTLVESIFATDVTIGSNGFSEATLFAGFGGGNNSGATIAAFDNFSVTAIPEPRVYAALAGLFALGLVLMRRRRRD